MPLLPWGTLWPLGTGTQVKQAVVPLTQGVGGKTNPLGVGVEGDDLNGHLVHRAEVTSADKATGATKGKGATSTQRVTKGAAGAVVVAGPAAKPPMAPKMAAKT